MPDPEAWLARREPAPPRELERRLGVVLLEGESVSAALGQAAMDQVSEVLARPGPEREAAFHLLAADALITYACEAAADEDDVEVSLSGLLGRLGPDTASLPIPRGS